MILLNPGPVTLSERVRGALLGPDLCHREPEYSALQTTIREKLLAVYDLDPAQWAAILISGSGTAAVEAMIASLVPGNTELITVQNGVYGERIERIARAHGLARRAVLHEWHEPIKTGSVRQLVHPNALVAAVQHETTTGRLNAIAELPGPILLDAVSSFGAEAIPFGAGQVEACAATANKCLHGVPGVAFVIARRERLAAAEARTVYLDLGAHGRAQDAGDTLFTPAVQAFYALDAALDEHRATGGWQARRERYRSLSARIRRQLLELGVLPLLAEDESSSVLTAYRLPAGKSYAAVHDALKAEGFVIYAGQGHLSTEIFRLAVMGAIAAADLERLLSALRRVFT